MRKKYRNSKRTRGREVEGAQNFHEDLVVKCHREVRRLTAERKKPLGVTCGHQGEVLGWNDGVSPR